MYTCPSHTTLPLILPPATKSSFSKAVSLFLFCKFICIIALISHIYPLLLHPVLAPRLTCTDYIHQLPSPWALVESAHGIPGRRSIRRIREKGEWQGYCSPEPLTLLVLLIVCSACPQPTAPLHVCPHLPGPPQPHLSLFLGPGIVTVLLLLAVGPCTRPCTFPIPHPDSYNASPCK